MVHYLTILSGYAVTSCVTLERTDRAVSIAVPSCVSRGFNAQFAETDPASQAPSGWVDYCVPGGTGGRVLIAAAPNGVGVVEYPPTRFMRVTAVSSTWGLPTSSVLTTGPLSLTITELVRR